MSNIKTHIFIQRQNNNWSTWIVSSYRHLAFQTNALPSELQVETIWWGAMESNHMPVQELVYSQPPVQPALLALPFILWRIVDESNAHVLPRYWFSRPGELHCSVLSFNFLVVLRGIEPSISPL